MRKTPKQELPPAYVADLLQISLETQTEDDRMLALSAANSYDRLTRKTDYGRRVLHTIMAQQDITLRHSTQLAQGYTMGVESVRMGKAMREVSFAIGREIATKTVVQEAIMLRPKPVIVTMDTPSSEMTISAPEPPVGAGEGSDSFCWNLCPEYPYLVKNTYFGNMSAYNFNQAMGAVIDFSVE